MNFISPDGMSCLEICSDRCSRVTDFTMSNALYMILHGYNLLSSDKTIRVESGEQFH